MNKILTTVFESFKKRKKNKNTKTRNREAAYISIFNDQCTELRGNEEKIKI